jgi:hypothetical protein
MPIDITHLKFHQSKKPFECTNSRTSQDTVVNEASLPWEVMSFCLSSFSGLVATNRLRICCQIAPLIDWSRIIDLTKTGSVLEPHKVLNWNELISELHWQPIAHLL